MPSRPYRVTYLVSHPIQYQAPMLRLMNAHPEIDLEVLFLEPADNLRYFDKGFGQSVAWDTPLLEGYRHASLPKLNAMWHRGLSERLRPERCDVLWTHGYSHPTNVRAIAMAHRRGIPVLLRGESTLKTGSVQPWRKALRQRFLDWCLPRCSAFLCIGTLNREYYAAQGMSADRLFLMPYAVDNEFFQRAAREASAAREEFRQSLGLSAGRPVILFTGKLLPHKGPHDLLDAYIRLSPDGKAEPHPYLLFAGSGVEQDALTARAQATGWNSIRFLGFQNQSQLPRLFDLCDLFVLPSRFEPWGLVVNEVMNAAKPVVVCDEAGCAPDLVADGVNGWQYPAGSRDGLGAVLQTAMADPSRLATMGTRSLERINRWSYREDIDGLLAACASVVKGR